MNSISGFAQARKDPEKLMKAGLLWGVKERLLSDFYRAVEKVLEVDPKNEPALLVMDVKRRARKPLPRTEKPEAEFRSLLKRGKEKMGARKRASTLCS